MTGNTNTESPDGTEIPGMGRSKGFMTQTGDTTEYTLRCQRHIYRFFQFWILIILEITKIPDMIQNYHSIRKILRQMYIIFRKMEHGHIIWMQMEQQQFDLPKTETTFLLVGNIPGMAWDPSAKPNFVKSSENENIYSITLNAVPAGKYQYKILEDAATKGWDKPWAQNNDNLSLNLNAI